MKPSSFKDTAGGQLVLDAFRRIVQILRQSSKHSEKSIGLSTAQIFILRQIAKSTEPLSINQLAELTATHQSSVSVVVKKLAALGLLSRHPAAHDARSLEITLTDVGRSSLAQLPPLIQDRFLEGFARMSESEQQALVTGLQAFIKATGLDQSAPALFFEESL